MLNAERGLSASGVGRFDVGRHAPDNGAVIAIPPDLKKALRANAEANVAFTKMPPSHQRRYVDWIGEVKRPETRAKRVEQAIKRMTEPAGFSKRRLSEKLGIKAGQTLVIMNAPTGYKQLLLPHPEDVKVTAEPEGLREFIQYFAVDHAKLDQDFGRLKDYLAPTGALWISWPKGGSKIKTDLNENIVRDIGLAAGLVDVKVIAIDADWSGLKFIYRTKDRPR